MCIYKYHDSMIVAMMRTCNVSHVISTSMSDLVILRKERDRDREREREQERDRERERDIERDRDRERER